MNTLINEIYQSVIDGNRDATVAKVAEALDGGVSPVALLNEGMISAMMEVGQRFEGGEYFVPEMLIAARAMKAGMELLKPYLKESGVKPVGKVIIGTVTGDLHDIGKNLVAIMMEGAGFEVLDLGTDVHPDKFVEAVKENMPQIVAMSALLTTTMTNMKTAIEALEEAGLRDKVKIMVGGAPVTDDFAKQVGADGFAPDASRAAGVAKHLVAVC